MNAVTNNGTRFSSDHVVVVELEGPNLPNLDFVDLPGLIAVGEGAETTMRIAEAALKTRKGRAIVLAVLEAGRPSNQSLAFQLVERHALQSTTVGVLTKCDELMPKLFKDVVDAVVANDGNGAYVRLTNGYVATMLDPTCASTASKYSENGTGYEPRWFRQNPGLHPLLRARRAGVADLISFVSVVFSEYVTRTWIPQTRDRLNALLMVELQGECAKLGVPFVAPGGATAAKQARRWIGVDGHVLADSNELRAALLEEIKRRVTDVARAVNWDPLGDLSRAWKGMVEDLIQPISPNVGRLRHNNAYGHYDGTEYYKGSTSWGDLAARHHWNETSGEDGMCPVAREYKAAILKFFDAQVVHVMDVAEKVVKGNATETPDSVAHFVSFTQKPPEDAWRRNERFPGGSSLCKLVRGRAC